MAESDNGPSFGGMPLGVLELNVFIGGAEFLGCFFVLRAIIDWPPLPDIPDAWVWWLAPLAIVAVLGLSVLGLLVEGLAGIVERIMTREGNVKERVLLLGKGQELQGWYATLTEHPGNWSNAQRWIWTSAQAADEWARRRLRILVARNTIFNVGVLTILATVLVGIRAGSALGIVTYVVGVLVTLLFVFVWIDATKAHHRAVADAGSVDAIKK